MQGFIPRVQVETLFNERGQAETPQARRMAELGYDPGLLRPMVNDAGNVVYQIRNGKRKRDSAGKLVLNEQGGIIPARDVVSHQTLFNRGLVSAQAQNSALPYEAWQRIDDAVLAATRDSLEAWNDVAAANTYGGFDGMGVTGLIKDTMTDGGSARVDMDDLSDDLNDAPLFTPDIVPLPIIHAGFFLGQRRLATSRNAGVPLDTAQAEAAAHRCAETLEDITIGMTDLSDTVIGSSSTFDNRGIFGYRTHDDRITKTDVTASASFVAQTFVQEVLAMIELARAQKMKGPFTLYYSGSWDQYMSYPYWVYHSSGGAAPSQTVLQHLESLKRIRGVKLLDRFTSVDELLLVQLGGGGARAIDGMDWVTVQWEEQGGSRLMYRVMGIKVLELRSRYIGASTTASARKVGVVHGTTS